MTLPIELITSVVACEELNTRSEIAPQTSLPTHPAANATLSPAPATGLEKFWVSTR